MAKRGAGCGVEVESGEKQIDGFLAKYTPEIEKLARACRAKLKKRLPGATELVYDNYNALAFGFGPSEKASEAIFSIALYPKWVSLFFLQGAKLADPHRLLKGSGKVVRHLVLASAADLDRVEVKDMMALALAGAKKTIDPGAKERVMVKSIAAKQRPRRPS